MRLPRMTTRRWMVVVAVVGILCLLVQRHRRFSSRADYHESKTIARMFGKYHSWVMTADQMKTALRHESLAHKYRRAARFPWLPVEPDPSEPE